MAPGVEPTTLTTPLLPVPDWTAPPGHVTVPPTPPVQSYAGFDRFWQAVLRWFVSKNVVPLLSARTTRTIGCVLTCTPLLSDVTVGSPQFVIAPSQMPQYVSRRSCRPAVGTVWPLGL